MTEVNKNVEECTGLEKEKEKEEDIKQIKAKATIMLLQAQEYLELKQQEKAREMFILMGESLQNIKDPDSQALQLLEISCNYLVSSYKSSSNNTSLKGEKDKMKRKQNILILKYNKFSGEFEIEDHKEVIVSQDIIQYVSKINTVLFSYQNVQNDHSLVVILKTYWLAFLIIFLLMIITVFLISNEAFNHSGSLITQFLPILSGGFSIVPLIMIYFKQPEQRDTLFFEKKLGEYINQINIDCKLRNKPLVFYIPHGGEINIRLEDSVKESEHRSGKEDHDEDIIKEIKGLTLGFCRNQKQ